MKTATNSWNIPIFEFFVIILFGVADVVSHIYRIRSGKMKTQGIENLNWSSLQPRRPGSQVASPASSIPYTPNDGPLDCLMVYTCTIVYEMRIMVLFSAESSSATE